MWMFLTPNLEPCWDFWYNKNSVSECIGYTCRPHAGASHWLVHYHGLVQSKHVTRIVLDSLRGAIQTLMEYEILNSWRLPCHTDLHCRNTLPGLSTLLYIDVWTDMQILVLNLNLNIIFKQMIIMLCFNHSIEWIISTCIDCLNCILMVFTYMDMIISTNYSILYG